MFLWNPANRYINIRGRKRLSVSSKQSFGFIQFDWRELCIINQRWNE